MASPLQTTNPSSYVIIFSGTHVTGKETLSIMLSKTMGCPWIKAEPIHAIASFGANSQAKKGFDYSDVFGRIWLAKLQRLEFRVDANAGSPVPDDSAGMGFGRCLALLSCYAMRRPARDAIRKAMLAQGIKSVFVILNITKETLSGRTLGAEEPELAEKIMAAKAADIEEPAEDEADVLLVDSMKDVSLLFEVIRGGIYRVLADGGARV